MDGSSSIALRAEYPGRLPAAGQVELAGVQLPVGQPVGEGEGPHFWRSDATLEDSVRYASALAQVFECTGLWPLIWTWSDEDAPENYYDEAPDLRHLGAFSAEEVLQAAWDDATGPRPLGEFPGLAPATVPNAPAQTVRDPFARIAPEAAFPFTGRDGECLLLLVPCRRPADAIAALGWDHSFIPLPMTAAVLRSWEERFGAVPVAVEPSSILLSIDTPVSDTANAKTLAGELIAITDQSLDQREEYPSGWSEIADCLLGRNTVMHHSPPLHIDAFGWHLAFAEDPGPATLALRRRRRAERPGASSDE